MVPRTGAPAWLQRTHQRRTIRRQFRRTTRKPDTRLLDLRWLVDAAPPLSEAQVSEISAIIGLIPVRKSAIGGSGLPTRGRCRERGPTSNRFHTTRPRLSRRDTRSTIL